MEKAREMTQRAQERSREVQAAAEAMAKQPVGSLCPDRPERCEGYVPANDLGAIIDCPHLDDCPHADERAAYQQRIRLGRLGFGASMHTVSWEKVPDDVSGAVELYRDSIDDRLRLGEGFVLSGPVGAGKTAVLALVALTADEHQADVEYTSVADLYVCFHDGLAPEKWADTDLLLLDDLGAEYADRAGFLLAQLQHLIDLRWQQRHSMIVATNLTRETLETDTALRRTYDRLQDRCPWLRTSRGSQRTPARVADWQEGDEE